MKCENCEKSFDSAKPRQRFCSPKCRGAAQRKRLSGAQYERLEKLAADGFSEKTIARKLGMSVVTWRALKDRDPRAVEALGNGRAAEEDLLVESLTRRARDPKNPSGAAAAMFLLKTRHVYRENADPPGPQTAVIVIPGAMNPETYAVHIQSRPVAPLELIDAA